MTKIYTCMTNMGCTCLINGKLGYRLYRSLSLKTVTRIFGSKRNIDQVSILAYTYNSALKQRQW